MGWYRAAREGLGGVTFESKLKGGGIARREAA